MQQNLNLAQDSFRLVRIEADDARERSDDYLALREHVLRSEDAYPHIAQWFDSKVHHGLRIGERLGFVGLINEQPVAAAILKGGQTSKFCHLKIDESARSRSLGDLFFTLMTLEVRNRARQVRFTLPESVWESRKPFFHSFNFKQAEKSERQYRLFDTELYSQSAFDEVFAAARQKLPMLVGELAIGNHSLLTGAVLSVQPRPLEKILSGEKTVEIRARFSKQWEGRRISLYATRPNSGLAGEATVAQVFEGSPDRIWELFGSLAGCTRSEYEEYVAGRVKMSAICLTDVRAFRDRIPLAQLTALLGIRLVAPQSYLSLENNDEWLAGVVLAAALQGFIGVRPPSPAPKATVPRVPGDLMRFAY